MIAQSIIFKPMENPRREARGFSAIGAGGTQHTNRQSYESPSENRPYPYELSPGAAIELLAQRRARNSSSNRPLDYRVVGSGRGQRAQPRPARLRCGFQLLPDGLGQLAHEANLDLRGRRQGWNRQCQFRRKQDACNRAFQFAA